jgi:segregation and condensation protein B
MQNAEQDIKDDELNENVPADEATEPETADSARKVDHAHQEPDPGLPEPVAFEPDETPPQKPEPEDEFAPPPPTEAPRRVGHAHQAAETLPEAADQPDEDDEPDDTEPLEPEEYETTLETVIEAVLFASDEPLTPKRLVDIAEAGSVKQTRQCIRALNKKYKLGGFSFRVEKIAGGYQMMTLPAFNPWLGKLIKVRTDNKLSPAALETLAVVAYKQPIIRADVEAIRGVASGEVIRNLMYKGLVKIVGRAEILGRPMLYGTTKKFLDTFGLNTLKDLPKVDELKNPEKG